MWTIKKFGALYNTVSWWEWDKCHYPTRLDTYWQGCWHNCSYCYARALLDFRWLRHPNNPKFIDLKEAYRIIATEIPKDQITVCEDVKAHYDYWNKNVNFNPDDCCNLRK